MKYTDIADELIANATAVNDEVSSLAKLFAERRFLVTTATSRAPGDRLVRR